MKDGFIKILFASVMMALPVHGQGTFQNLDFESASLSPAPPFGNPPDLVPVSSALPDWTADFGTIAQSEVGYNFTTLGAPNVALLGPTWSAVEPGIIDGNFSVILQAGFLGGGTPTDASISQTGTVPLGSQSMVFKAWEDGSLSDLGVSFAGHILTPVLMSSGSTYNTYAVNIAPYAGDTGSLEFSAIVNLQGPTWVNLDDISFSPQAIPEPSPLALTGIGGLLFVLHRRIASRLGVKS